MSRRLLSTLAVGENARDNDRFHKESLKQRGSLSDFEFLVEIEETGLLAAIITLTR